MTDTKRAEGAYDKVRDDFDLIDGELWYSQDGANYDTKCDLDYLVRTVFQAGRAEAQRWIPVSAETLPPLHQVVMLCDAKKEYWWGYNDSVNRENIAFEVHFGSGSKRRADITHWQPLPPAPAAVTEKGEG